MFASHEVTVDASYEVSSARLVHLINRGALLDVSEAAYRGGLQGLVRVGPFGGTPGVSKLVRVRALDPIRRGVTLTVPLRWEATGLTGELFPVLDADLTLMRDGADRSRLGLVGSYRPPLGRAGIVLDRAVMGRVAAATIRSLLDELATVIADPAAEQDPGRDTVLRWWPVTEPGQP